jgi:beta-lactamase class A
MQLSRRHVLAGGVLLPWVGQASAASQHDSFRALEARDGGRLGVCVFDTGTGRVSGYRLDQRFAMCSTFKLPLAAFALDQADHGLADLDQVLPIAESDRVPYHPVTAPVIGKGGMTLQALVRAAQTTSDNVAANVALRHLGGPNALTEWLRKLGDRATRLDRYEPELNLVPKGEVRDTTTPRAFAVTVAKLTTGGVLKPASRQKLVQWTVETQTGLKRLRAGLPATWIAGDKTGTASAEGMAPKANDVAIAWPPGRAPIIISCFYEGPEMGQKNTPEMDKLIADAARIAA